MERGWGCVSAGREVAADETVSKGNWPTAVWDSPRCGV